MKCWAKEVSTCCETQSREHYVSKGLFSGKSVVVDGFPFLEGRKKEISLASLTTKSLCQHHNSLLSPFDSEAIKFTQALLFANNLSLERMHSNAETFEVIRKKIDADLFSRWVLKTFVGLLGFFPYKPAIEIQNLAEMVFSNNRAKKHVEYKLTARKGDEFQTSEIIHMAPLQQGDSTVGLEFSLYGISMRVIIHESPIAPENLPKLDFHENKQGLSCVVEFI